MIHGYKYREYVRKRLVNQTHQIGDWTHVISMYCGCGWLSVACYSGINLQIDQFNHRQIGRSIEIEPNQLA